MKAVEYLLRYLTAYREVQSIERKITEVRMKYAAPSAIQYDDMPKAHNVEHDLSDYMAKVDALVNKLIAQQTKCIGIEADILDRIDMMQDSNERTVLRMRYTMLDKYGHLMPWYEVADRMGYSVQQVYRFRRNALKHFPVPLLEDDSP